MDRYYVKESSGYRMRIGANQAGNAVLLTEVLVLDRDYCHRVVWSSWGERYNRNNARLPLMRARAAELVRKWNAEDRADVA